MLILVSNSTIQTTSARIGEQSALAREFEDTKSESANSPISEGEFCHPNTGWIWTIGPSQPDIAAQVQQTLAQMAVEAAVEATSIGETDSCGTFRQYAMDFDIHMNNQNALTTLAQQNLVELISSTLSELGTPKLGNVTVTLSQGTSIQLNNSTVLTSEIKNSAEINTAQVNAKLSWQATGISYSANEPVKFEVTGGLWTHWLGTKPYNNGVGESYICANTIPANQCTEPLPEARKGSLIGKIGGHIFAIGSGTTITAQESGELYLRINDEDAGLFDNDGILTVDLSSPTQGKGFTRKVYVVVYDPLLSNSKLLSEHLGWNDHETLTQQTIDFFKQASSDHLTYSVVDTTLVTSGWPIKTDGFQYTETEYLNVIQNGGTPHSPDAVDYNDIVNDPALDICGKANRGEIDEVWIYNGPYFGFYESTLVGPGAYWYNSPPVPEPYDCTRLIPIMGPSPERTVDSAVHNFGHRTESAMREVYGSWQQNRTAHNWERFALVDHLSANYSYSGCGNTHFPPNGTSDYNYGNSITANTNCGDFLNYPYLSDPVTTQPVTCTTWGCNEIGYHNYWFSHLPAAIGCGSDNVANDWWRYLFEPERALNPSSLCNEVYLPSIIR